MSTVMQRLRRGARVAAGAPCRSDVAARFQVAARAPARTSSVLPTRMANAGSTPSSSSGGGCGDAQGVASAARLFRNRAAPAAPARGRALRTAVVCMAHPRRVAKVASQVQREISDMLHYDTVMQNALAPERKVGLDQVLSVVPSVTHVYVSNDLQVVKVYVSIYSDNMGRKQAMTNLKRLEPYVRREMGQRVPLRLTPEYRFEYDDTLDEMELVQSVIGEEEVARLKREIAIESGEMEEAEAADEVVESGNNEEEGFFALDDEEYEDADEGEYEEISSSDVFGRPGPFDDLFAGSGVKDDLVQTPTMNEDKPLRGRRARGASGRAARQQEA